jgi:hypothetical protein
LIPFDPNIVLDKLKKPKKYITIDELPPPQPLPKPIELQLGCSNRPMTPHAMVTIIVGTKVTRFPIDNPAYLDYMISKLSIATPSIAIHRANVKRFVDYKAAQARIKGHELGLMRIATTNKKKRSKKTVECSIVDPETWEAIEKGERQMLKIKETKANEIAQKKKEAAKKKAANETKKVANAMNRAANKTAMEVEAAAAKKNPGNNRKGKKAGHSQAIEEPEEAIHQLFSEANNEAEAIEEDDVIEQLNAELQAATNEAPTNEAPINEAPPPNNHRPKRVTRVPPRFL